MSQQQYICDLDELANKSSKGFSGNSDGDGGCFLVRKAERIYAYANSCPHTGASLEWQPDQFLDYTGGFIECSIHGALFEIESGRCLRGPCVGQHLKPRKISITDNRIYLSGD